MNAVVEAKSDSHEVTTVSPMDRMAAVLASGASVDQLQKLMEMQERWEANQARKAFDSAIAKAKASIKPILKNKRVLFTTQKGTTDYKYEDLAQVASQIDPILAALGLSYRYRSQQEGNKLSVTCVLAHKDGHSECTTLTAANDESGNKNNIQGIGSAATYLQRYTLKLALGLAAAKDDDGKGAGANTITESQRADLQAKAEEVGADKEKFLAHFGIESLADMPANRFQEAVRMLEQKGRQRK